MAYHYIDSGLDNVWLENGYIVHETPYGQGLSIHNTEGLHRAIGAWIIACPKPLNGADVRFLRREMELTQRGMAGVLNASEQAVRRWEKARSVAINGSADRLLRVLYHEFVHGDGAVRPMIERLAGLDQADSGSVRFRETKDGWRPDNRVDIAA